MTTEDNSYDELRWLAKDTHKSRRRAMWWTAGLTAGAITLATAYVSREPSTGAQPGQAGTPTQPAARDPSSSVELQAVIQSLNAIKTSLDQLGRVPIRVDLGDINVQAAPALGNVVWLLEGSRRFPMALGDILWVPEADRWMRLERRGTEPAPGTPTQASFWMSDAPPTPTTQPAPRELPEWFNVSRGAADCLQISSLGVSRREGFTGPDYVEIEAEFYTTSARRPCPVGQ